MAENSDAKRLDVGEIARRYDLNDLAALKEAVEQALVLLDAAEPAKMPAQRDPFPRLARSVHSIAKGIEALDAIDHYRLVKALMTVEQVDQSTAEDLLEADIRSLDRLSKALTHRTPTKRGRKPNTRTYDAVYVLCQFWRKCGRKVSQDFLGQTPLSDAARFVCDVFDISAPHLRPQVSAQMEMVVKAMRQDLSPNRKTHCQ